MRSYSFGRRFVHGIANNAVCVRRAHFPSLLLQRRTRVVARYDCHVRRHSPTPQTVADADDAADDTEDQQRPRLLVEPI